MRRLHRRATLSLLIAASCSLCACSSQAPATGDPAATAGATGSKVGCSSSDGDVYVAGMRKPGAAGRFDFTLVSSTPAPPALDYNQFVLQVSNADGSAVAGELSVVLEMPEHGHRSPTTPEISFDAESGAFLLDPMDLFMVGLWRITFSFQGALDGATVADSAVFEFCID